MEKLEEYLADTSLEPEQAGHMPAPLDDGPWLASYLNGLEEVLDALGSDRIVEELMTRPPEKRRGRPAKVLLPESMHELSEDAAKEVLSGGVEGMGQRLEDQLRRIPEGAGLLLPASMDNKGRQRLHIAASEHRTRGVPVRTEGITDAGQRRLLAWLEVPAAETAREEAHEQTKPREEAPDHLKRLAGLSEVGGREAASRAAINALLLPLCSKLKVVASLEENCREEHGLPKNVCDYVLRTSQGKLLGVVEAKRCYARGWEMTLAKASVQCFLQLASLQASQGSKESSPLLGVVSDGRRWLCVELRKSHLAVTPVLDASQEANFWRLLRCLSKRLASD